RRDAAARRCRLRRIAGRPRGFLMQAELAAELRMVSRISPNFPNIFNLLNTYDPTRAFIPGAAWTPPGSIVLAPGVSAEIKGPLNGIIYYWVHDPAMRQALEATEAAAAAGRGALRGVPALTP